MQEILHKLCVLDKSFFQVQEKSKEGFPDLKSLPGLKHCFVMMPDELTSGAYCIEIDRNYSKRLKVGTKAIFSCSKNADQAIDRVFFVGVKSESPRLVFLLKSDEAGEKFPSHGEKRNAFMSTTPLHVPKSRVSPVAPSTHSSVMLKNLHDTRAHLYMKTKLLWMHPLVFIAPS